MQFAAEGTTVSEGAGTATLTVSISNPDDAESSVSVAFDNSDGSAEPSDVGGFNTETITFPADANDGDTQSVTIPITDDGSDENNETANFDLTDASANTEIGAPSEFTLTIDDNDDAGDIEGPTVQFTTGGSTVDESEGTVTLAVSISNPNTSGATSRVDVVFDDSDGNAESSDVGGFSSETITFPAGANNGDTQSVTVPITDDGSNENSETANFDLVNARNATVGAPGDFNLTINNSDGGDGAPQGAVVINEYLADPSGSVDANEDGTVDNTEDEFVEVFNVADAPVALSGYTLTDAAGNAYSFPDGTALRPGEATTIFGGGDPSTVPGFTDTGLPSLDDDGDTITLSDASGTAVDQVSYEAGEAAGTSRARNPNGTGPFQDQDTFGPMTPESAGENNETGQSIPVAFAGPPQAKVEGRTVALSWRTASETRNDGFHVQHRRVARAGAGAWVTANPGAPARIPSKAENGTSASGHAYEYRVADLAPGRYLFRVEQVDTDGDRDRSATTRVEVASQGLSLQAPYPNPLHSGETAALAYSAEGAEHVTVSLFDALGKKVRTLHPKTGTVRIETEALASGLYFVRLQAKGRVVSRSITVVR